MVSWDWVARESYPRLQVCYIYTCNCSHMYLRLQLYCVLYWRMEMFKWTFQLYPIGTEEITYHKCFLLSEDFLSPLRHITAYCFLIYKRILYFFPLILAIIIYYSQALECYAIFIFLFHISNTLPVTYQILNNYNGY